MDGSLADEDESVQRFVREASLAQAIDSPHVVKIFDQGFTDQYGFMVMEFFSRGDLKHRIETGITTPPRARIHARNRARSGRRARRRHYSPAI